MSALIPAFSSGHAVIGVCDAPFKCPPAPSEAALLLHDDLVKRGVRDACQISVVIPFSKPVPPSPETSEALLEAFAERDINYVGERRVSSITAGHSAVLDDGSEIAFDLFLGVPRHVVPDVVAATGMIEERWVPVNPRTLETSFPQVYAVGDVAGIGVPKAGVFAEGAARIVAESIIATARGEQQPEGYDGRGSCYIEFGAGRVGRVDVDFFSGPRPTGSFNAPSELLVTDKKNFGSVRRARWFDS
jgi:sulfide:quinone oxidoreductase